MLMNVQNWGSELPIGTSLVSDPAEPGPKCLWLQVSLFFLGEQRLVLFMAIAQGRCSVSIPWTK